MSVHFSDDSIYLPPTGRLCVCNLYEKQPQPNLRIQFYLPLEGDLGMFDKFYKLKIMVISQRFVQLNGAISTCCFALLFERPADQEQRLVSSHYWQQGSTYHTRMKMAFLSSQKKPWILLVFGQQPTLVGKPVKKEGNKELMVPQFRPTRTELPACIPYAPMDRTPFHLKLNVRWPWRVLITLTYQQGEFL